MTTGTPLGPTEAIVPTRFWHALGDGRIQCDACPRACKLREGQRGLCFVRARLDGRIVLTTYGRSSGFCIDPIEKKPLNHFLPGTAVLSFGTAGCNLACRFCQNWDISKARRYAALADRASPEAIAQRATELGCRSVAFTYNDPVVFHEYAVAVADACRRGGMKAVAVTAGYITPEARGDFFGAMDAANVDLKAFTERFYEKLCYAHLEPVKETLSWLARETQVWLEVTTLVIPGRNDSDTELRALTGWIVETLGPLTPWHVSRFFPAHRMMDVPPTPTATLLRAADIGRAAGLKHVYVGNAPQLGFEDTLCAGCGRLLIERSGYRTRSHLTAEGACHGCGRLLEGVGLARRTSPAGTAAPAGREMCG